MFFVIETCEREISSVTPVQTLEEGVKVANALLEEHAKEIDRFDELEDGSDEGSEYQYADTESQGAWCNYSYNWDAHIIELTKDLGYNSHQ